MSTSERADSHSEQEVPVNVPVLLYNVSSTNQCVNLVMMDDPGRVRRQITRVVCQIRRFDFDCNLAVTRK